MKCPVSSSVLVMELDVIMDSTWGPVPITTLIYIGKGSSSKVILITLFCRLSNQSLALKMYLNKTFTSLRLDSMETWMKVRELQCTYIHTYIHTYIQTDRHTDIHIYVHMCGLFLAIVLIIIIM